MKIEDIGVLFLCAVLLFFVRKCNDRIEKHNTYMEFLRQGADMYRLMPMKGN
jgi:hypothetical protein